MSENWAYYAPIIPICTGAGIDMMKIYYNDSIITSYGWKSIYRAGRVSRFHIIKIDIRHKRQHLYRYTGADKFIPIAYAPIAPECIITGYTQRKTTHADRILYKSSSIENDMQVVW
jgi:hypothetical protein